MKNKEMLELIKKYQLAIEKKYITIEELLSCTDEEMKIYKQLDIDFFMRELYEVTDRDYLRDFFKTVLSKEKITELVQVGSVEKRKMFINDINDFIHYVCMSGEYSCKFVECMKKIVTSQKSLDSGLHEKHMKIIYDVMLSDDSNILKEDRVVALLRVITNDNHDYSPNHLDDLTLISTSKKPITLSILAVNENSNNSLHHIKDMHLLENSSNAKGLLELATNKVALRHPSYREASRLVSNDPSFELTSAATNLDLIKSPYYLTDLEAIAKAKNKEKKTALCMVATNQDSIESMTHPVAISYILNEEDINKIKGMAKIATSKVLLAKDDNSLMECLKIVADAKKSMRVPYVVEVATRYPTDEHLISDIMKILNVESDYNVANLYFVATNSESLNSDHHQDDMELLFTVEDNYLSDNLARVATSRSSLKSLYHRQDMELISKAKKRFIIDELVPTATSYESLKTRYHGKDMELISKAEKDYIARELKTVATNSTSLKSKHHESDMELISKIDKDYIAKSLSFVATNREFMDSIHHKNDMKTISRAKTDGTATELAYMAVGFKPRSYTKYDHLFVDCYTQEHPYHLYDMAIIEDYYPKHPEIVEIMRQRHSSDSMQHMMMMEEVIEKMDMIDRLGEGNIEQVKSTLSSSPEEEYIPKKLMKRPNTGK